MLLLKFEEQLMEFIIKRLKEKNNMTFSIGIETTFNKI